MKSQPFICLVISLFMSFNGLLSAQKIYLSPAGDDKNPGNADKPLATLTAARDKARELRINKKTNER